MKEVPVPQPYHAVRRNPQRQSLKLSFRGRTVPYLLLRGRFGTFALRQAWRSVIPATDPERMGSQFWVPKRLNLKVKHDEP